jgi:hypothetical protein
MSRTAWAWRTGCTGRCCSSATAQVLADLPGEVRHAHRGGQVRHRCNRWEKAKLLQATRAIQTDSGIIMPKGMELDLLEAGRSGTADYKALQDYMDATIQKVVLGQTASTQGTPGKLGNDQLQREVRRDIITSDADLVCESFNKGPARWLTEWNFPGAAIPRVYRVTEEPEDLDATASRDKKISTWATSPSRSTWIRPMATTTSRPGAAGPPAVPTAIDGAQFADAGGAVISLLRRHYPAAFADGTPKTPDPAVGWASSSIAGCRPLVLDGSSRSASWSMRSIRWSSCATGCSSCIRI